MSHRVLEAAAGPTSSRLGVYHHGTGTSPCASAAWPADSCPLPERSWPSFSAANPPAPPLMVGSPPETVYPQIISQKNPVGQLHAILVKGKRSHL